MRIYKIDLDQNVTTYIERLHYEYEVLKDNIAYMMNRFHTDNKFMKCSLFKEYQNNEITAKVNLERGMQEVYEKYIPEYYKAHRISWSIDFQKSMLVITLYCDCEV